MHLLDAFILLVVLSSYFNIMFFSALNSTGYCHFKFKYLSFAIKLSYKTINSSIYLVKVFCNTLIILK